MTHLDSVTEQYLENDLNDTDSRRGVNHFFRFIRIKKMKIKTLRKWPAKNHVCMKWNGSLEPTEGVNPDSSFSSAHLASLNKSTVFASPYSYTRSGNNRRRLIIVVKKNLFVLDIHAALQLAMNPWSNDNHDPLLCMSENLQKCMIITTSWIKQSRWDCRSIFKPTRTW